jgi:uncharacterized membrane protein YdfJ with MMPL/SSD domain
MTAMVALTTTTLANDRHLPARSAARGMPLERVDAAADERIREEYHRRLGPKESVVVGLSRVGRIVLAAGAIMTAVFLGFASDPDVVVKTIGLGLASAILIDVLVVRMVVAPAVMAPLGDRAWGLPGWLDRLLPHISLEGEERPVEQPLVTA